MAWIRGAGVTSDRAYYEILNTDHMQSISETAYERTGLDAGSAKEFVAKFAFYTSRITLTGFSGWPSRSSVVSDLETLLSPTDLSD